MTDVETESESELDCPYLISAERWEEITEKMREEDAAWKKELKKMRDRKYREDNREKVRDINRISSSKYYKMNKEKAMESNRKYIEQNKEKVKERKRKYALENRDTYRKYYRNWAQANPEKVRERNRVYKKDNLMCRTCKQFIIKKHGQECAGCGGYRINSSEYELRDYVKESYPQAIFDNQIEGSCLQYRPDIFIETPWGCLVVECDEREHRDYDPKCEVVREFNIHQALGCDLTILRYNCDSFKPDGVTTHRLTKEERLGALFLAMRDAYETHRCGLTVDYLFYSSTRIAELTEARNKLPV